LQRLNDQWDTIRPIMAAAGEHPDAIAFPPTDEPESIVFDFKRPLRPAGPVFFPRRFPKRLQVATGASCVKAPDMQYGLREGDWVLHHSCPEPVRVIGLGSTIAVEFPDGMMRAFEPSELKKVTPAKVPRPKAAVHELRRDRVVLRVLNESRVALRTYRALVIGDDPHRGSQKIRR
jgi:hypothetical protein